MTKTLIIAEKPSVAADIAKALGGFTKHDDYFESDDYVLSSAVGHLLEIMVPEEYDVKRGKWSFAHLPMIPPYFALNPIAKTETRLKVLTKLIKRKDVSALINACDAGREGELIFRLIAQHAKAKQSVQRLWLQSMTPGAIRDGFQKLRSDEDMLPLADAARCRSESDWLIGINGTRAMTAFNSKEGGFYLTTVGRVQTPTLSIVVEREEKIKKFVSRDFWEVRAEFVCAAGIYEGRWLDPQFKKDEHDPEKRAERLWSKLAAESIVAACRGRQGNVSEESKPASQIAPALFDLTSLQREANSKFGFSAKNTLGLAQALYEKHKVLTYPRTDSRHLPEDYLDTVKQTLSTVAENNNYYQFAAQILNNNWVKLNKRIFDNSKISDHFAIIPTGQAPKNLSEPEQKLYDLVTRRFLAVFFPAAEFQVTTRITEVTGHQFKTEGKVMTNAGWLAIYGKEALEEKDTEGKGTLVAVAKGEKVLADTVAAHGLVTKPPARYSEATLLSAMEGAGKLVDDGDLREAMAGKGLGTPATRAAIIEGLLTERYLLREGREMMPTAKAFQLMTLLRGLGVDELTSPELTGEWEYKLSQMEKGKISREEFMREIAQMTQIIVKRAKEYDNDTIPGDYATLHTPCPHCGAIVKENYRRFACTKCDFSMSKTPGSRQFEVAEVEELLSKREIGPLQGFRSKMGRPFAAILKIVADTEHNNLKLEFDFGQNQDEGEDGEGVDFTGQTVLGPCPKCAAGVYEMGLSYVCEKSMAKPKACDFRSGRIILQQEILPEQMVKLLVDGKTDLLPGFVSQRTRRPFKAFLVRGKDGKVSFEFEERKAKAPAAGKAKAVAEGDAVAVTDKAVAAKKAPAVKKASAVKKVPAVKKAAPRKTKAD
ncbi:MULTISPECIES: DNA topoisomerase III [unclassified Undibacterium]|uniref:DNA topoisomerase III n=1 Tax=unclassified Undibacterium TaxID=2630295 RepID=UPI002AC8CB80|nr:MULTISPECIES: DNA topoisomerase III [unclassified Undibacterium]MEB0137767.1 DNA topoisomerase III [Undibacterium sp. CCC2.1]MEB0171042.1 DNA topoisomerase III [Undibacterium sp. CCC1.1]MEB0175087.1 DNA topoisomerase III [Undibacterium sp. CCC3.4]MEB0215135.1 DNA topoisomerase III [Undibacterium sp. 5I2]WPX44891.1 DNA topoisomerase III [Undibacterium sp. CCC3.4]